MKKIMLGLIIILLAGCVKSIDEVRNTGSFSEYPSNKQTSAVSECILHGWQTVGTFSVTKQENDGNFTVYLNDQWAMADINKSDSGSVVKYYRDSMLSNYLSGQFIAKISECIK